MTCFVPFGIVMKWLRQNAVVILVSAAFVLFAGINVGAYASYVDSRQVTELQGDRLQHHDDALPVTAFVDAWAPAQNFLSRNLRTVSLDGFGGRNANRGIVGWHGPDVSQNTLARAACHSDFPTALSFNHPKEFYIYTLERMLC